jgi:tetratricopeptide (TPR) repeat protein
MVIRDLGEVVRADLSGRVAALGTLAQSIARHREELEPWLLTEVSGKAASWVEELESVLTVGDNAVTLTQILPPLYDALRMPDAAARKERLFDRAVRHLMKNRRHQQALSILEGSPRRAPELEAECLKAMEQYARAAEVYRAIGKLKEALACYRLAPDFDAALAMIRDVGTHPAAEAYEWLDRLRRLVAERPQNFNRVMQASEKKILEQMLEEALGVARKKPAPRRTLPKTTKTKGGRKRT